MKRIVILTAILLLINSIVSAGVISIKDTQKDTARINSKLPIYYVNENGYLGRINLDGTNNVLSKWAVGSPLQFSPNGKYIIFKKIGGEVLVLMDTDNLIGREIAPLVKTLNSIQFSPASDKIAIVNVGWITSKLPVENNLGVFIIDISSLKIQKIGCSAFSKRNINVVYGSNLFWSDDGKYLYIFFDGYEPVPVLKEGYADKRQFFELYKLNMENQQISFVKEWIVDFTLEQFKGEGDQTQIDKIRDEVYAYKRVIPRHYNWMSYNSSFLERCYFHPPQSSDGRLIIHPPKYDSLELRLENTKTGEIVIVDKTITELKGNSSLTILVWTPDYKYIVYQNVDSRSARPTSFRDWFLPSRNKDYCFVYDIEKKKRCIFLDYVHYIGWFDPDFKAKVKQRDSIDF